MSRPADPLPRLSFTGLVRGFGRLSVLRDVSAAVGPGEGLLVTGANGSGKSTLLKCLAGLLAPERGTIEYVEDGAGPLAAAERRRRCGYVAPDLAFYEELSAAENLEFFGRLRGVGPERGEELLARVGLPGGRLAGALSSGMRQRLRWAWALLASPRLLLLDEPLQNLDEPGRRLSRELIAEHLAAGGVAVVANPSPLPVPGMTRHLDLTPEPTP